MLLPFSLPSSFSNLNLIPKDTLIIILPSFYKRKRQRLLRSGGLQVWNAKVHVVKSLSSLDGFKRKLVSHLWCLIISCKYVYITFCNISPYFLCIYFLHYLLDYFLFLQIMLCFILIVFVYCFFFLFKEGEVHHVSL